MKVMVVGCEELGCEIAKIFICNNHNTILSGDSYESIEEGVLNITRNLEELVLKLKISEEQKNQILQNLCATTELRDALDCDLVIEAICENIDIKKKLFKELDYICKRQTILATSTSPLFISELSSSTNRGDKVIGMNFLENLDNTISIEVINSINTSKKTQDKINDILDQFNEDINTNKSHIYQYQ